MQARQWSKELEARPAELNGYARAKMRYQEMQRTEQELFNVREREERGQ